MLQAVQRIYFGVDEDQVCLVHLHSIALYLQLNNWRKPNATPITIKLHMLRCNARNWPCCCTSSLCLITFPWPQLSANLPNGCKSGASIGPRKAARSKIRKDAGVSRFFPPLEQATVKAIACELPRQRKQPLSRYALSDLVRRVGANHPPDESFDPLAPLAVVGDRALAASVLDISA
jgi:hypothetical protein